MFGTAVYNFFNLQTNIKIGGTDKRGRNRAKYPCGVLFYHYDPCKKGYISLYVNSEIDIDFYAHYFTIMPQYAYALSDNGYALIRYIFYLARQRKQMKSIRDNGSFNISLDTIREALGFPAVDEVKGRKYKQYIISGVKPQVEWQKGQFNVEFWYAVYCKASRCYDEFFEKMMRK